MKFQILPEFSDKVSGYRAIIAEAQVVNTPTGPEQQAEMTRICSDISSRIEIPDINRIPAIACTRAAYKACGKDPNRYRPSQEQLMRRVVRGLGLYQVNAVVDAGNMFSLLTGCAIGFFDRQKVEGETITLGVGHRDEPYEGIGRGPLNIEGLPVVRDAVGGIGTPTSDNERTKLSLSTTHLLATAHLFDPSLNADEVQAVLESLLQRYASVYAFRAELYSI